MSKTTRSKPLWEAARTATTSGTGGTETACSWRNGSVWKRLRSSGGSAVLAVLAVVAEAEAGGRAPVVAVAGVVVVVTVVTDGAAEVDVPPSDTVPDRWSPPHAARQRPLTRTVARIFTPTSMGDAGCAPVSDPSQMRDNARATRPPRPPGEDVEA